MSSNSLVGLTAFGFYEVNAMLSLIRYRNVILAATLLTNSGVFAQGALTSIIQTSTFDALVKDSYPLDIQSLDEARNALWSKYQDAVSHDLARVQAVTDKALKDGDKTMRFSLETKGQKPATGYPLYIALHGGGSGPSSVNDSQWDQMKTYYLASVDIGIYVAARGITDSWMLHSEEASYRLYDQLIEDLVALKDVDPNRVYIMGFSAGGDGVYQITPRMPERFAAANMSAGHHNWIKFDNLLDTPFLIQVGENDTAYKRNTVAAENGIELDRLKSLRGGYVHDVFIHSKGSHNSWSDRDALGTLYPILAKPSAWLNEGNKELVNKDTAAVHWLRQFARNPYPTKIAWDPKTNAPRNVNIGGNYLVESSAKATLVTPNFLNYWLDLGQKPKLEKDLVIEAELLREQNSVSLKSLGSLDQITVLVSQNMLNLDQDISVLIDGTDIGSAHLTPDLKVMARTLLERGDTNFMFSSELNLIKNTDGVWTIVK